MQWQASWIGRSRRLSAVKLGRVHYDRPCQTIAPSALESCLVHQILTLQDMLALSPSGESHVLRSFDPIGVWQILLHGAVEMCAAGNNVDLDRAATLSPFSTRFLWFYCVHPLGVALSLCLFPTRHLAQLEAQNPEKTWTSPWFQWGKTADIIMCSFRNCKAMHPRPGFSKDMKSRLILSRGSARML